MEVVARTEYIKMIELQNTIKSKAEFEKKKEEISNISMYKFINSDHSLDSYTQDYKLEDIFDEIYPVYLREFQEFAGKNNQLMIGKKGIQYSLIDLSGSLHDSIQMEHGWKLQLSTVGYTCVYFINGNKMKIFNFLKQNNESVREKNDQLFSRHLFKFKEELAAEYEFDLEKTLFLADYKDSQKTSFAVVDENHQIYRIEGQKVIKHQKITNLDSENSFDSKKTLSFGFPYLRICIL